MRCPGLMVCPRFLPPAHPQTALAVAVGEESCQFEHRDLHWGNLLIRRQVGGGGEDGGGDVVRARLRGVDLEVATDGVEVRRLLLLSPLLLLLPPSSCLCARPGATCFGRMPVYVMCCHMCCAACLPLLPPDSALLPARPQVTLIDFTLSRLVTVTGEVAYCDLAADPELFKGPKGSVQVCGGRGGGREGGKAGWWAVVRVAGGTGICCTGLTTASLPPPSAPPRPSAPRQ